MPDEITPADLDRESPRRAAGLPNRQFETVARHLVAAGRLVDEDPEQALAHALAARRRGLPDRRGTRGGRAGRLPRRSVADRHVRAADLPPDDRAGSPTWPCSPTANGRSAGPSGRSTCTAPPITSRLTRAEAIELLIVAAGARRDLGQRDAAVAMLQVPELTADEAAPWVARLRYAYADALLAAGRTAEAREWFVRAAAADAEDDTDAAERLLELDGVTLDEVEETPPEAGVPDEASAGEAATEEATAEEAPTQAPATEPADQEPDTEKPDTEGPDDTEEPATGEPTTGEPTTGETATVEAAVAPAEPAPTPDRPQRLVDGYDLVILDLDGVVYVGERPSRGRSRRSPGCGARAVRVVYATNNASRSPARWRTCWSGSGSPADRGGVLTSAAVAADVLARPTQPARRCWWWAPRRSPVSSVGRAAAGRPGDRRAAGRGGARVRPAGRAGRSWPRRAWRSGPARVGRHQHRRHPAQPAGAAAGQRYRWSPCCVPRSEREPDLVVGKPQPALFTAAASRPAATAPLVVGDRLDTDIEGAHRAGLDSLLVLTGVTRRGPSGRAAPQPRARRSSGRTWARCSRRR